MNESELWSYLSSVGNLHNHWWFSVAALPAALLATYSYALAWYALRHEPDLARLFVGLVGASVPLLLILPSLYVVLAPQAALERGGLAFPGHRMQLSPQTAQAAGRQLSLLAALGIGGATLSVALLGICAAHGGMAPPALARLSHQLSRSMTRTITPRRRTAPAGVAGYGAVRVVHGAQRGAQFGVKPGALIGKEQATMTLTDAVVSRRHARFEIQDAVVTLVDERSTNGTHLMRAGRLHVVVGQGIVLEHGDQIFLGHPAEPEAVELVFERLA